MAGVYRSRFRLSTKASRQTFSQASRRTFFRACARIPAPAVIWVCLATTTALALAAQNAEPLLTFDRYHTVGEFHHYLRRMAGQNPTLVRLFEIGRSRLGRPILAIEINNPETGKIEDKPGFYVDGNIHGGEVLGGEGALFFVHHLLENYESEPELRKLVDSTGFYVVPVVNPDGRAISVDTPENHRWNVRPTDEDGDGLLDEDPPEDLDGDGRMLRMRVVNPNGQWVADPQNPRQMVRKNRGRAGATTYDYLTEGIDNDLDGRFNEDRVGGVDLNRNFPANWHPGQFASGPYPLSEPESRALVEYITSRPQIAAIHTFHTSGGLILRFPTLADQNWDYPTSDLKDYQAIAEDGVRLTGYANYAFDKKAIVDLMNSGHGVFNDWASKVFGVFAITTEMWRHAMGRGGQELFAWNDRVLGGKGFIDWYSIEHPQLGEVELGGWDRWSTSSPPHHLIRSELERNNQWVLTFAHKVPRIEVLAFEAVQIGQSRRYQVKARVANLGWMATATEYAEEILKTAEPVRVELLTEGAEVTSGQVSTDLGVMPGARELGPVVQELGWEITLASGASTGRLLLSVRSQKAGSVARHLTVSFP